MKTRNEIPNFGALIDRTLRVIKQQFIQLFKELELDITPEQWVLIDFLARNTEGVSQTQLANGSFKNAPTISRIVELLRKKDLLIKKQSKTDKRQSLIFLSPKGKQYYEKAYPRVMNLRKEGWNELSLDDYSQLERIMNKVFENFSEEGESV